MFKESESGESRTVEASVFRAKCLQLMDEVADSGKELVITKHGRPVARLAPYRAKPEMVFGRNRKNIHIVGDIVSPMPAEWFDKPGDTDQDLY